MTDLTNHILYIAHKNDSPITILQLQKIRFFILGYLTQQNKTYVEMELEAAPIEAWLYGPSAPKLHNKYRVEARSTAPIPDPGQPSKHINDNQINEYIIQLINTNPFTLVEKTREMKFWTKYKPLVMYTKTRPGYTYTDILNDFKGESL